MLTHPLVCNIKSPQYPDQHLTVLHFILYSALQWLSIQSCEYFHSELLILGCILVQGSLLAGALSRYCMDLVYSMKMISG